VGVGKCVSCFCNRDGRLDCPDWANEHDCPHDSGYETGDHGYNKGDHETGDKDGHGTGGIWVPDGNENQVEKPSKPVKEKPAKGEEDGDEDYVWTPAANGNNAEKPSKPPKENPGVETDDHGSTGQGGTAGGRPKEGNYTDEQQKQDYDYLWPNGKPDDVQVASNLVPSGKKPAKDKTRPDQTILQQPRPEQTRPFEGRPEQTRPEQTSPEQTRPEQTNPDSIFGHLLKPTSSVQGSNSGVSNKDKAKDKNTDEDDFVWTPDAGNRDSIFGHLLPKNPAPQNPVPKKPGAKNPPAKTRPLTVATAQKLKEQIKEPPTTTTTTTTEAPRRRPWRQPRRKLNILEALAQDMRRKKRLEAQQKQRTARQKQRETSQKQRRSSEKQRRSGSGEKQRKRKGGQKQRRKRLRLRV
jgi:hypothetical protein